MLIKITLPLFDAAMLTGNESVEAVFLVVSDLSARKGDVAMLTLHWVLRAVIPSVR